MPFSAFDIIGPAMIGPSSSHTAGAVRLGLVANALCEPGADEALIELHGSFATTGAGHATDRGILAGLLGFSTDDDRIKDAFEIARDRGFSFRFSAIELGEEAHPNSARITLFRQGEVQLRLTGASVGGGSIHVTDIDGFSTDFAGELDLLYLRHADRPGFLSKVTTLLSCVEANIAAIHTARRTRGTDALTVIQMDSPPVPEVLAMMRLIPGVTRVATLARLL